MIRFCKQNRFNKLVNSDYNCGSVSTVLFRKFFLIFLSYYVGILSKSIKEVHFVSNYIFSYHSYINYKKSIIIENHPVIESFLHDSIQFVNIANVNSCFKFLSKSHFPMCIKALNIDNKILVTDKVTFFVKSIFRNLIQLAKIKFIHKQIYNHIEFVFASRQIIKQLN